MNRSWLWTNARLARRSGVVLAVATLGLVNATAASAHAADEERSPDVVADQAQVLAAIEDDLGLNEEQAIAMLAASAEATELDAQLRDELGDAYAGSWLHPQTGVLTVAVTDPRSARTVRASGARAELVSRGMRQLDTIMAGVGAAARADDDGPQEWYVDPETNQVVVTFDPGRADAAAALRATYGDAIRVETTAGVAQPGQSSWLDGGIAYDGCSTGFNLRDPDTGSRYFLTAGHCHTLPGTVGEGGTASSSGNTIGPVTWARYGPLDVGLVEVTNTAFWNQGPYVWTYGHFAFGDFLTVDGWIDPPVGTSVCRSGRTSGLTCGTIQAKGVTVNYDDDGDGTGDTTVTNLVRDSACRAKGDSGGPAFFPNFNGGTWTATAVGLHSGQSLTSSGACRTTPISYYYPLSVSLPLVESFFGAELWL